MARAKITTAEKPWLGIIRSSQSNTRKAFPSFDEASNWLGAKIPTCGAIQVASIKFIRTRKQP